MEQKIAGILNRRGEYVRQLIRMKKQMLEHKQLLRQKAYVPMQKRKEADLLLQDMQEALTTFRRGEIELSVLGGWKYGRGAFISKFTGIDQNFVPFHFPGTIHNTRNMEPGQLRADLTFYTQEEMLENVKNLISTISENYLQGNELEFEDIPYVSLGELEAWIEEGDAHKQYAMELLSDIVNDFSGCSDSKSVPIRDLCGKQNLILTKETELRKYVDRSNDRRSDDPLREEYRSYFAVKRVDLYTRFRWTDARLAFSVDIPDAGYHHFQKDVDFPVPRPFAKVTGKDAVVRADAYRYGSVSAEDLRIYEELCCVYKEPDKRFFNVFLYGGHITPSLAEICVRAFREQRIGAGASAMDFFCGEREGAERLQQDILLPLLKDLPDLDRETMKSLQDRMFMLTGNEV